MSLALMFCGYEFLKCVFAYKKGLNLNAFFRVTGIPVGVLTLSRNGKQALSFLVSFFLCLLKEMFHFPNFICFRRPPLILFCFWTPSSSSGHFWDRMTEISVIVPGESKQELSIMQSLVIFPSPFLLIQPN